MVALQIGAMPLSRTPQYDSLEYLGWAQHLVTKDFRWPYTPPHGPGYPFFLAGLLAVLGGSVMAIRVGQQRQKQSFAENGDGDADQGSVERQQGPRGQPGSVARPARCGSSGEQTGPSP